MPAALAVENETIVTWMSEIASDVRESVARLLADHSAFDKRRAYLAEPDGWSRALWAHYAELGLLGVHGLLHLAGWDHVSTAGRKEMTRLTVAALELAGLELGPGRL